MDIMYSCMEMEKWDYEISPGMVEGEIKGNDRGE
jgi:hypothetical protein